MDARRSSLVPPQPRQAAMRDAQEAGSGLNTWSENILSDMRNHLLVLPDPATLHVYIAHQSGIPAKDWNQLLVTTFDQRWRPALSDHKVLSGYADGVIAFGADGQPLVEECLTRLQSSVRRGNAESTACIARALSTAIVVAGTHEQIECALPAIAGTWLTPTAPSIVDHDAHHIGQCLAVRAVGGQRTSLLRAIQALAPTSDQPWTHGELLASRLLVDVGDHHPSAVTLVRGLAVNVMPPTANQQSSRETWRPRENGKLFWEDGASRNRSVITWCDQQVRQGRVRLIRDDDTLRDAVLATAISGSLPGTDAKDGDGIHALACQVAARVTAVGYGA